MDNNYEGITMKKKITRRKFLCNVGAVCLLGTYSCGNKITLNNKKTEITSKALSNYDPVTDEEKIFKDTEYLFANIKLRTVAKIIEINSYEFPDGSFQISVDCKAFDDFGTIHDMDLEFFPREICQRDRIIEDLKTASIYFIKGGWSIIENCPITLYEPDYKRIEPEHLENQMKKMFKLFEEPRFF